MLHFFSSVILGAVEGLTEFLPISSTAHLILAGDLMHIAQSDFQKSFEIIIQLGAILSVVALYWRKIFTWEMIKKLVVAFIPTGIIGLAMYKILKTYLLGNTAVILWSILIGGVVLILFERAQAKNQTEHEVNFNEITYKKAFAIGFFQAIAIIPGVSRSAATIIGGMAMGIKRKTIVEFSFLLAVPTMLAASGLDLLKSYKTIESGSVGLLLVGFIVSFITAMFSIKFFIGYIKKHDFRAFGWYRIVLAVVFWFILK
ncbi:undecaprenyl-diphosphate phosphatase [Patescibacteria group bacterium]|nr:undecaprenyl-diphosphate phosphatase [Patescibacteria group bacterium]